MTAPVILPGIAVDPVVQGGAPDLPPMDVAGFAGFAARGPCHQAIAVDSVASFTALFGDEVTLAAGRDGRAPAVSRLASTVRGFFANGGRRCWVVRLARTIASEAQWEADTGRAPDETNLAEAASFPMPGVLQRLPWQAGGGSSRLRPAWLAASSVGSWADAIDVQVRITPRPFALSGCADLPGAPDSGSAGLGPAQLAAFRALHAGVQFDDPGGLAAGDLVEFTSATGATRRFARIIRRSGGKWHALWVAAFAPATGEDIEQAGKCQFAGSPTRHDVTFNPALGRLTLPARHEAMPPPGSWVQIAVGSAGLFLSAEQVGETTIAGPVWRQIPHHVPGSTYSARAISFDLRTALGGASAQLAGLAAGFAGTGGPASLTSDDDWFAPRERRRAEPRFALAMRARDRAKLGAAGDPMLGMEGFAAAAARMGTTAFTAADREVLRACWLPLGCEAAYAAPGRALPSPRRALQRDGLSRFDEALFVDPAFAALSTDQVAGALTRHRDLAERQLFGIHALLDTPDTRFGTPTILAAPDMAQPGWELEVIGGLPHAAPLDPRPPARWLAHEGGCPPPAGTTPPTQPDFARFLDCDTRLLAAPDLSGPVTPVSSGTFTLRWTGGDPGVPVELEQSAAPDFAASARIYAGTDDHLALSGLGEGAWYFRLRANDGTNVSAWSVHAVVVRPSDYATLPAINPLLPVLQIALLRAAAGSLDNVALLPLPGGSRPAEAAAQARRLTDVAGDYARPDRLGPSERRALSYGALHYGWLLYRAAPESREALLAAPPEGCVAGQMAMLARTEGAWIAPANRAVADCAGVDPQLSPADRLILQEARINALGPVVRGFAALDAMTLSAEPEWGQINVRRLMIFLRLVAMRRGEPLVFESNGDQLRRALEREFAQMLGDFQRRGAFAGRTRGWRLAVETTQADRDNGRIVAEIGVAPSQPLRFLTFRLVQQGARLTLAEAA